MCVMSLCVVSLCASVCVVSLSVFVCVCLCVTLCVCAWLYVRVSFYVIMYCAFKREAYFCLCMPFVCLSFCACMINHN